MASLASGHVSFANQATVVDSFNAEKTGWSSSIPRRRRSAKETREKHERAQARVIGRLLRGVDLLEAHRGNTPTRAMSQLAAALKGETLDSSQPAFTRPAPPLCWNYPGNCKFGDMCRYRHDDNPDSQVLSASAESRPTFNEACARSSADIAAAAANRAMAMASSPVEAIVTEELDEPAAAAPALDTTSKPTSTAMRPESRGAGTVSPPVGMSQAREYLVLHVRGPDKRPIIPFRIRGTTRLGRLMDTYCRQALAELDVEVTFRAFPRSGFVLDVMDDDTANSLGLQNEDIIEAVAIHGC